MIEIVKIIKNSKNRHEVLKKLNWDCNTQGYRKINKFIKTNNIDISHFETQRDVYKRTLKTKKKLSMSEILIENSTYENMSSLKRRLFEEGLKERRCEKCEQNEWWYGEKISLILDHVNGIHDDNRIENLRILCPNCNATLPTHCGKNKKNFANDVH